MRVSPAIPTFPDRVYRVVAHIPHGRVTTYGLIARSLGAPRSARMVGWVLRRTPPEMNLPCHRVVNRIGLLSGGWHFGHPDIMRDLLRDESIPFRDDYQVDLSTCLWNPADDPDLDSRHVP
ncbi:MAG: MGMT family protein [Chloroflexia bacterium]|nr:MGMT family protein [Chloroflexia bacterium]